MCLFLRLNTLTHTQAETSQDSGGKCEWKRCRRRSTRGGAPRSVDPAGIERNAEPAARHLRFTFTCRINSSTSAGERRTRLSTELALLARPR